MELMGIEPTTSTLPVLHSPKLSYSPKWTMQGSNLRHLACKASARTN